MADKKQYVTSAEACTILGVHRTALWAQAGRFLSPPVIVNSRKALWVRAEVDALAAKLKEKAAKAA